MIRFGLCCTFAEEPIKFVTTTVTHILKMERSTAIKKLSNLCQTNANSLMQALQYCKAKGIGCFRINSHILPIYTHDEAGYKIEQIPEHEKIISEFKACGRYAAENNIRTCFHPDQFVVLNSKNPETVRKSIAELEYQGMVAEWVNADVINIHGGGAFGNKKQALIDFAANFYRLSPKVRSLLTVENDDTTYTPQDLFELCETVGVPLVYDAHHHRCNSDSYTIAEATDLACETWDGREPLFHLSSPKNGWGGKKENQHHDYISQSDFPECWKGRKLTVELEAKAKELAVCRLLTEYAQQECIA